MATNTVTDSRHFMHLLTEEQRALERQTADKELRRSRGEAQVMRCLELPPPPLGNTLSTLGARKWQIDAPTTTLGLESFHGYFQMNSQSAWNHEKRQAALDEELEAGEGEVDAHDATGRTRLMWAAMRGQYDCALRLLDSGASMAHADIDGWTAVTWAAAYGQVELLQLLIDRGAQLEVPSETNGWLPFHYACYMGKPACVRALIQAGVKTDGKVKANIGKKRWTTGIELAELQARSSEEHAAVIDIVNTVKSNEEQAAEDAAAASAELEAAIARKTATLGVGMTVAQANAARVGAAGREGADHLRLDEPMTPDELKNALVQKRRTEKMLADRGVPDATSTPRGQPVAPEGAGSSRGVYLAVDDKAAEVIMEQRAAVFEAVQAAAGWLPEEPELLYCQLLRLHEWLPEAEPPPSPTGRKVKHSPRGAAARAADNADFVRLCRAATNDSAPFVLVPRRVALCSDNTIRLLCTVEEPAEPGLCPLNELAGSLVASLLREGPRPPSVDSHDFCYDEAALVEGSADGATAACFMLGACAPGTQPVDLAGVHEACAAATTALAEVRIEVGGVELLQHTRRPFGGSLPDPRCCVWKSSLPLSG